MTSHGVDHDVTGGKYGEASRSLLERVRLGEPAGAERRRPGPDDVAASIARNLRRVFDVRQGSAQAAPAYGLPDFTDVFHAHSNPTSSLCAEIKRVVERLEPRLDSVRVERVDDGTEVFLRFQIRGEFVFDARRQPLVVETLMTGPTHLTVHDR